MKCFGVIFAFPCSVILLTNSAVSLRILGTLNGFAVSTSAIGRAIGPALGGASFTWGLERGYVVTPWFLMGIIAAVGAVPIWWLVEMPGFSKTDSDSDTDSDDEEEDLLPTVEEDPLGEILEANETLDDEEAIDAVDGPPLGGIRSRKSTEVESGTGRGDRLTVESKESRLERRMSSPIGVRGGSVGPGGARRLSNGLAASNLGHGTGGTSFA